MIHMIGNAHLDPVWLWEKREGFAEVISTMAAAVERIEENKQFIFTCSSACYYEYVKEHKPDLFAKIKKYVKNGRWNIVGGWYIQPDNNIPSGETYARHALYSQRFYLENFGVTCKTGYTVDTFGHNANIPQLLKQGGMENFVFMRPDGNERPETPALFYWNAVDGSRILTYRIVGQAYAAHTETQTEGEIKTLAEFENKNGHDMMCFYGVGDHGGGPTKRHLLMLDKLIKRGEKVKYSCPDTFFDNVRAKNPALPEHSGELQMHAIGCYSVASHIKAAQRRAERMLLRAEKLNYLAHALLGTKTENDRLQKAYKRVLFNTFHDIMCGCSVKDGLDTAMHDYSYAVSEAQAVIDDAVIAIAKNTDTMIDGYENFGKSNFALWEEDNKGVPVTIFNTESYETTVPVKISWENKTVLNEKGEPLPLQYVFDRFINDRESKATLFNATVPATGYVTYWMYRNKEIKPSVIPAAVTAKTNLLENDILRVRFDDKTGAVTSVTDKRTGAEHLCGNSFVPYVLGDKSDTWSHGLKAFPKLDKKDFTLESASVVECGALTGKVRFKYRLNGSCCVQDFSLYNGEDFIRADVKFIYREFNSVCRIGAAARGGGRFVGEAAYGHTEMPADGSERVVQQYAALSAADGSGLALITENKPSFCADGNELAFVAVRNSIYAQHYAARLDNTEYDSTDDGLHAFGYLICPYKKLSPSVLRKTADKLYAPEVITDTYHKGALKRAFSLADAGKDNIRVEVIKAAEDGAGTVIRMYETAHAATSAKLSFNGRAFDIKFRAGEIKTVKIENGKLTEHNFTEL